MSNGSVLLEGIDKRFFQGWTCFQPDERPILAEISILLENP